MPSSSWHRALLWGLLLFGASLGLSKGASNILLVGVGLATLVGALFSPGFRDELARNLRQPLTVALCLLCLVAYFGTSYTENLKDGFSVANKFVSLPAIYGLVSVLLQSAPDRDARNQGAESLLLAFLAGLTVLNLAGVLTFLGVFGNAPYALPLAPLELHHIWFSNLNALGLYTAASFLLFTRHGRSLRGRMLLGGFLSLASLCILLSTSRTAWLSLALTAAIMAVVAIRSARTIALAALLAALALAAVYQFVPLVRERVDLVSRDLDQYADDKYVESSIGGRLLMWRATLIMIRKHPIMGVGTGDFEYTLKVMRKQLRTRVVPRFLLGFNQPHNMYLFALATNGIAGIGALLYLFYRCLRLSAPIVRADGAQKLFAFLAMATAAHFMIAGNFDSFFNIQVLRYSFAFIMGVCLRNHESREPRA